MAAENLESNLEEEKKLDDMTEQEKIEWASNFLKDHGFNIHGGKQGEGKEDALNRAASGTTRKPGSHKGQ